MLDIVIHVVRGRHGGLLQAPVLQGEAVKIFTTSVFSWHSRNVAE